MKEAGKTMKISIVCKSAAVFLAITAGGCSQTKPAAPEAMVAPSVESAAMALSAPSAQAKTYSATTSGSLTMLSGGVTYDLPLKVTAELSFDSAQNMISGTFKASFKASDGKQLTMPGKLDPAPVAASAFSGKSVVSPFGPNTTFKDQSGTHIGTASADMASVSGSVTGSGNFTDRSGNGTFTYKFEYIAAAVAK